MLSGVTGLVRLCQPREALPGPVEVHGVVQRVVFRHARLLREVHRVLKRIAAVLMAKAL